MIAAMVVLGGAAMLAMKSRAVPWQLVPNPSPGPLPDPSDPSHVIYVVLSNVETGEQRIIVGKIIGTNADTSAVTLLLQSTHKVGSFDPAPDAYGFVPGQIVDVAPNCIYVK